MIAIIGLVIACAHRATFAQSESATEETRQPSDEPASTQPASPVEDEAATRATSRPGGGRQQGGPGRMGTPTVIIAGGRILTMDEKNRVVEGTITIRDGKIGPIAEGSGGAAMGGGGPRRNPMLKMIDAKGRYVTPGLIDAWSSLGVAGGGPSAGGKASLDSRDVINSYELQAFLEAIQQGVTSICVEPPSGNGVAGLASLVRLENLNDLASTTTENVCLVIRVGLGRVGPFGRLGETKSLREMFESAKEYREAWEEYEEELEKYKKELKAGKTVKLKKDDKEAAPEADGKPTPPPREGRGPRRGRRPPRDDSHSDWSAQTFPSRWASDRYSFVPGAPTCPKHPWVQMACCCPENHGEEQEICEHDHVDELPLPEWLTLDIKPEGGDGDDKDKKKDGEFAKPELPARDPHLEVLVNVLKRELPVRFEVHRPADVLNILDIVRAFHLNATISGATGAGFVAEEIAESEANVLLAEFIPSASYDSTHTRDLRFDNVRRLQMSGVSFVIASGANGAVRTGYLAQNAAIAVGQGMSQNKALRAITIEAARLCGADETIGSIEKGKKGDVVVWKGHPLAPDSEVEYVFIGGRQAWPVTP
ncbi:MAG: amidohydrolase family protein [Planctomycetes bacterium]|nr:amidohydrolase family protein [Planctomycetota bacterium]